MKLTLREQLGAVEVLYVRKWLAYLLKGNYPKAKVLATKFQKTTGRNITNLYKVFNKLNIPLC